MKKFIVLITLAISFINVTNAQAVMQLEKTDLNYSTVAQNSDPLRKIKFKNVGNQPLIIKSAIGSCGCTVPNFKREPIMPGEWSEIEIRYDTQRLGDFSKNVTIETNEANGKQVHVITVHGSVVEKVDGHAHAPHTEGKPRR